MDAAFAHEKVTFVEVPRPTGISNFLIELPSGEPCGWLTYSPDKDEWAAHISYPEPSTLRRERFTHREDAERWVDAVVTHEFDWIGGK